MYSNCIPPYHVPVRMRMIYLTFIQIIAHNMASEVFSLSL